MRGRARTLPAAALVTATMCACLPGCFPDYAVGGAVAGGDGGAQSGQPWCQRAAHTFCFDFDEGSLASGWNQVETPAPASFTEDPQDYTSPPRSGLLTGGDAGNSSAGLGTDLPAGRHVHCEADVRVDVAPPEPMYVLRVDISTNASDWYHAQLLSDGSLAYETSSGAGDVTSTQGSWTSGGWHRVMLDMALSPAGADGAASVVTITAGLPGSPATIKGPGVSGVTGFGVSLGALDDVQSVLGGATVRFDDVACDVSP